MTKKFRLLEKDGNYLIQTYSNITFSWHVLYVDGQAATFHDLILASKFLDYQNSVEREKDYEF